MTGPIAREEAFRREAGECLAGLAALLVGDRPPDQAAVRLARALRGASMMAGPAAFTRAAEAYEDLVGLVAGGRLAWGPAAAPLRDATVRLRRLADGAAGWDAAAGREAEAVAFTLRQLGGPGRGSSAPAPAPAADAAARSYLAGKLTVLVARLDLSAGLLAASGRPAGARLPEVTAALQPVVGLDAVADHPPLEDLLATVTTIVRDLGAHPVAPDGAPDLLAMTARALQTQVAALGGSGEGSGPEALGALAERVHQVLMGPQSVVPVEALLDLEGEAPCLQRAADAPQAAEPGAIGALGDTLVQAAVRLRLADSPPSRSLQAYALARDLRGLDAGLGRAPAGNLLRRLLEHLERSPPAASHPDLPDLLERAGLLLRDGADGHPLSLGAELDQLGREFLGDPGRTRSPAPLERPVVPIGALLEEEHVVPIEALLADDVIPIEDLLEDPVPIAALGFGPASDRTWLEEALSRYGTLLREGAPAGGLASLLAPAPSAALPAEPGDVVGIEQLLYRGEAAIRRAQQIRRELESALRPGSRRTDLIDPLVRELLDLVPLALGHA